MHDTLLQNESKLITCSIQFGNGAMVLAMRSLEMMSWRSWVLDNGIILENFGEDEFSGAHGNVVLKHLALLATNDPHFQRLVLYAVLAINSNYAWGYWGIPNCYIPIVNILTPNSIDFGRTRACSS